MNTSLHAPKSINPSWILASFFRLSIIKKCVRSWRFFAYQSFTQSVRTRDCVIIFHNIPWCFGQINNGSRFLLNMYKSPPKCLSFVYSTKRIATQYALHVAQMPFYCLLPRYTAAILRCEYFPFLMPYFNLSLCKEESGGPTDRLNPLFCPLIYASNPHLFLYRIVCFTLLLRSPFFGLGHVRPWPKDEMRSESVKRTVSSEPCRLHRWYPSTIRSYSNKKRVF